MIGRQAVDSVTGDVGAVCGVRVATDTDTVVPLTLTSAGPRPHRPPPGALAVMEDEVVARRSHWRRQRERETDATGGEFAAVSKGNGQKVAPLAERADALDESAKREVGRRATAAREFGATLPAGVTAALTAGDEAEQTAETRHATAHKRFCSAAQKLAQRVHDEEKRHVSRFGDLDEGNEAERTAALRHQQVRISTSICCPFAYLVATFVSFPFSSPLRVFVSVTYLFLLS